MTSLSISFAGRGLRAPLDSPLLGLLLTPMAVAAGTLAAWRFGVDAGWTRTFFIADGFLSHWQVWLRMRDQRRSQRLYLESSRPARGTRHVMKSEQKRLSWRWLLSIVLIIATVGVATLVARWAGPLG